MPKMKPASACAWIQGKLLLGLLVETICREQQEALQWLARNRKSAAASRSLSLWRLTRFNYERLRLIILCGKTPSVASFFDLDALLKLQEPPRKRKLQSGIFHDFFQQAN
jgi:hypothetical protein